MKARILLAVAVAAVTFGILANRVRSQEKKYKTDDPVASTKGLAGKHNEKFANARGLVSFIKDPVIYTRGEGDPGSEFEAPIDAVRPYTLKFPEIKGKRLVALW